MATDKINVNELKNGSTILVDDQVYLVLTSEHSKSGRGQAHVKIKAKNLITNSTQMLTFTGGDKLKKAFVEKGKAQFLYQDEAGFNFMNNESYEQFNISANKLEWEKKFIKEGMIVTITSFEGLILGIELDTNVTLKVAATSDAVKGNTVSNATKKAILETGFELDVPQFIKNDDLVIVSSETGKYVSKG